jgi:hypothetical protein
MKNTLKKVLREGNLMNRSLLFILCVMLAAPLPSFGMHLNRGLPANQAPGITGDEDTPYNVGGKEYTIFKHCGDRYAYAVRDAAFNARDVYKNLDEAPCAELHGDDFNLIRTMGKQMNEIQNACAIKAKTSWSWLSEKSKTAYLAKCNDMAEAIVVAFRQGGGNDGLGDALAFRAQLREMHQNILHEVKIAKMKFYGPIVLASAVGIFGLYKFYQWWYKQDEAQEVTEDAENKPLNEEKTTDTPLIAAL